MLPRKFQDHAARAAGVAAKTMIEGALVIRPCDIASGLVRIIIYEFFGIYI